jgi:acyl-CoA thioesterase-1
MQDIRICFLGDSFVNGTGDSTYLGWVGRLCAQLSQGGKSVTGYNLGIRRETSAELAGRWQDEVQRRLPEGYEGRLVFSFGTNDTAFENGQLRVETRDSLKNLRQILETARGHYPVLMVGPPPVDDPAHCQRLQGLSQQFSQACQALSVPYLDVLSPLLASPIWMAEVQAGDGAHPDARGYAEYAHLVQSWPVWSRWFP